RGAADEPIRRGDARRNTVSVVLTLYSRLFLLNHTAPPETYTLSLHDALPILGQHFLTDPRILSRIVDALDLEHGETVIEIGPGRSEEHTSELQSRFDLVCRLLLEKKNKNRQQYRKRGATRATVAASLRRSLCS